MIEPHIGCRYAVVRVTSELGNPEYAWGAVQALDHQQALVCFHIEGYRYTPPELVSLPAIESLYMEPPKARVVELNKELEAEQ